ncbi:MAG: DUF5103 domain-containing protein, partial [Bacteroidales bacterium]|nr:DUF5103 domain-containing protein [Bacteroidales bacterium]
MSFKVFFMMIIPLLAIYNAPGQDDTGSMAMGWNCYREVTPEHIRTALLYREGWELSDPVIRLETDDRLQLSFDDLQSGVKDYRYTVVHCNADWSPSPLRQDEYISGYREG